MELSDDVMIKRLALRLLDQSLPKSEWTHAGHFAAAFWLLRHQPALTAPDEMRRIIMRYNEATNTANTDSGGYHHTITIASMRVAADFLKRQAIDAPLHLALRDLLASPFGHSDWLLAYWSNDRLFSVSARRNWIEPDLLAMPFSMTA